MDRVSTAENEAMREKVLEKTKARLKESLTTLKKEALNLDCASTYEEALSVINAAAQVAAGIAAIDDLLSK